MGLKKFWKLVLVLYLVVSATGYRHKLSRFNYPRSITVRNLESSPRFISSNQSLSAKLHEDVAFTCEVDRKDKVFLVIFKYVSPDGNDKLIFVGDGKITDHPRISKMNSTYLLKGIVKTDSGNYVCLMETNPKVQIYHSLNVLYETEIRRVGPNVKRVVLGSSVTLQCIARGNPSPLVEWTKNGVVIQDGEFIVEGTSLTLPQVTRKNEGNYMCKGFNTIGKPKSDSISLQVEYKPQIEAKQSIEFKGDKAEAHLECIVHGLPRATVHWFRKEALKSSKKHVISHKGNQKYKLIIKDVTEADFDDYFCQAENKHGKTDAIIRLTGQPKQPNIISTPAGSEESIYRILWETEAIARITMYRLKYRRVPVTDHYQQWIDFVHQPDTSLNHYFFTPQPWNNITGRRRNIVTTESYMTNQYDPYGRRSYIRRMDLFAPENKLRTGLFKMGHIIVGLHPSEDYEAKVMVENIYGWSEESDSFHFYTRKNISVGHSTSSNGISWSSSSYLFSSVLLYSLIYFA